MSNTTPQSPKTNFLDADDLRPIIKFISKNWYLLILFSGIGWMFALIYTHRLPNIYAAKTEILLKSNETYDYQTQIFKDIGYYSLIQDITNQKRIITSFDLIGNVMQRVDFTKSYFLVGRVKTEQVDRFAFFDIDCDWRHMDKKLYGKPINLKIIDVNSYSISYEIDGKKLIHDFEFGKLHEDVNFSIQVDLMPRVDEVSLKTWGGPALCAHDTADHTHIATAQRAGTAAPHGRPTVAERNNMGASWVWSPTHALGKLTSMGLWFTAARG